MTAQRNACISSIYNNAQIDQHTGNRMCVKLGGKMAPRHQMGYKKQWESLGDRIQCLLYNIF